MDNICSDGHCINKEFERAGLIQLPRSKMPQFNTMNQLHLFLKKMEGMGIEADAYYLSVPITKLVPTQTQISRKIVNKTMKNPMSTMPIIISSKGSVIDGHHRMEAIKELVRQQKASPFITVFCIDLPSWMIIGLANHFGFNKSPHYIE